MSASMQLLLRSAGCTFLLALWLSNAQLARISAERLCMRAQVRGELLRSRLASLQQSNTNLGPGKLAEG